MHPATTAPDGYTECNGAAISRTGFAWLFGKIGTTYGAGNGSTTFNVPDFRGEFVRGWDHGRGVDSGRGLGTAQGDELKSHTHQVAGGGGAGGGSSILGFFQSFTNNVNTGASGGSETRPRNVAQMFCIATKP